MRELAERQVAHAGHRREQDPVLQGMVADPERAHRRVPLVNAYALGNVNQSASRLGSIRRPRSISQARTTPSTIAGSPHHSLSTRNSSRAWEKHDNRCPHRRGRTRSRGPATAAALPKQYALLAGEPMLRHALSRASSRIRRRLSSPSVIHPDDAPHYSAATEGVDAPAWSSGSAAGKRARRRCVSVSRRSRAPRPIRFSSTMRRGPFVGADVISRVIDALRTHAGAIAAEPSDGHPQEGRSRRHDRGHRRSRRPVACADPAGISFRARSSTRIAAPHAQGRADFTDDASLAEWAGTRRGARAGLQPQYENYARRGSRDGRTPALG